MFVLPVIASFALGGVLASTTYDVKPFKIDIPRAEVQRMKTLAEHTHIPSGSDFSGSDASLGITRDQLVFLRDELVHKFDWEEQQAALNKFHHYTVQIENMTLHFIHEKSKDPNAIPLIMSPGWPGSFLEYLPTVPLLTRPTKGKHGQYVSYNVVIPSLPGFDFSPLPSPTWTLVDTTRIFNKLMVDVLGYEHYTVFGNNWGSAITYNLYSDYQKHVKAAHFAFLTLMPPSAEAIASENVTLTPFEEEGYNRTQKWSVSENGYFFVQTFKPNTIGLALHDSPVGQLAWLAEKYQGWSEPGDWSAPNTLTNTTILTSVALHFLTRSFMSALWTYSRGTFLPSDYKMTKPAAPMGFTALRYNPTQWPQAFIKKVGNLTVYREHARGGHFAGMENPTALVADMQELAEYWPTKKSLDSDDAFICDPHQMVMSIV